MTDTLTQRLANLYAALSTAEKSYDAEAVAEALAILSGWEEALRTLADSFTTGWASDCESRGSVIARAEHVARSALTARQGGAA